MSLSSDDLPNVQFDSNWLNAFVMDQDLRTLSAQYEDHVPAIGDSISGQLIPDPTSIQLDSVPSDGDALLEIIESEHEVERSKSGNDTVFGTTKTFEHSLAPPTPSLPACTEEIAFNYFSYDQCFSSDSSS